MKKNKTEQVPQAQPEPQEVERIKSEQDALINLSGDGVFKEMIQIGEIKLVSSIHPVENLASLIISLLENPAIKDYVSEIKMTNKKNLLGIG